jgi:hypothetical protein
VVIPFDEMPEDNADLANIEVEFPHLQPNTPESCPVPLRDVLEYLRAESPDAESVEASQLQFLRTALVADQQYWIWAFRESDGSDCFVTVSLSPGGTACTGYEENYYNLNPEQFMLGDFHQVF